RLGARLTHGVTTRRGRGKATRSPACYSCFINIYFQFVSEERLVSFRMKILISDNLAKVGVELLQQRDKFTVDFKPGLKPDELKTQINNYEGLIVRSESKVTADIIAAADNLKVIGRAGTGVDNIDVPAATQRGIVVMNAAAGNSVTTAEHTISLLMSLARKI